MRKVALLAVFALLAGTAVCLAGVPKGMAGFKGYLIGEIVSVDAEGLHFRVTGVVPIDGSKAENPRAVKGQKVRILFKCFMNKEGRYQADRELIDWIFKLMKEGDLVTLKVFTGDSSLIVEKAWHGAHEHPEAEKKKEGEKPEQKQKEQEKKGDSKADGLPEGAKGFSGMVRGIVVGKEKGGFLFKVGKILKVWKNNKAKNPESLVGKVVWVGPRWVKGEDGKWHPYELHVRFIEKVVKVHAEGNIEIINEEGDRFNILELSEEQRKAAGGEGEKKEPEKHAEKDPEPKKEEQHAEKEGGEEKGLPEKGVVVGEIIVLKDASFWLKVREASKDCRMLQGETMKFFAQWIKGRDGKWIPDPKEVQGFGQLRLGYIVKVEFYRDEHWRVKKIQIVKKSDRRHQKELRERQHELEKKEEKQKQEENRKKEKEKRGK